MKKLLSLLMGASLLMSACGSQAQQPTPPQANNGPDGMKQGPEMHGNQNAGEQPEYLSDLPTGLLPEFEIEEGIRIDNASNPSVGINEDGEVYLFHNNTTETDWFAELGTTQPVGFSEDGLEFELIAKSEKTDAYHPGNIQLADGTWRKYIAHSSTTPDSNSGEIEGTITSQSSDDNLDYTPDEGLRYEGHSSDNGSMGVSDFFLDSKGGVVALYIGDMGKADNTRRAYSEDTWTFEFEDDNVLDDIDAGKNWVHVDPNSTALNDGTRLLLTMVRGENTSPQVGTRRVGLVYGTLLDEDGYPIAQPQLLFDTSDFDEYDVWSLNDPVAIQMPNGDIRVYVAALITENGEVKEGEMLKPEDMPKEHWVILSAVSK